MGFSEIGVSPSTYRFKMGVEGVALVWYSGELQHTYHLSYSGVMCIVCVSMSLCILSVCGVWYTGRA